MCVNYLESSPGSVYFGYRWWYLPIGRKEPKGFSFRIWVLGTWERNGSGRWQTTALRFTFVPRTIFHGTGSWGSVLRINLQPSTVKFILQSSFYTKLNFSFITPLMPTNQLCGLDFQGPG